MTPARVRRILRRQGMPREEIRTVLGARDPIDVRRVLELHRERVGEWAEEQLGLVASIERSLFEPDAFGRTASAPSAPDDGDHDEHVVRNLSLGN